MDPETYTADYFLTECDGYRAYQESRGADLPKRLEVALDIARVDSRHIVLDIGCGRGEVVRKCALLGASVCGIDYSRDALELARGTVSELPEDRARAVLLTRADAKGLPFADASFDRVLMLDIVEHLHPWELLRAFREARRVLKPTGFLLVHTMPNRWYYAVGYPAYRLASRLAGRRLPRNPRHRWRYVEHVHVNEQDILSLRRAINEAGLRSSVWLHHVDAAIPGEPGVVALARRVLGSVFPLNLVFCNDIFAIATPTERAVKTQASRSVTPMASPEADE